MFEIGKKIFFEGEFWIEKKHLSLFSDLVLRFSKEKMPVIMDLLDWINRLI